MVDRICALSYAEERNINFVGNKDPKGGRGKCGFEALLYPRHPVTMANPVALIYSRQATGLVLFEKSFDGYPKQFFFH